MYQVYLARCKDGTLYTGVSKNVEQRIYQHNNSNKGAKYTRSRRPVFLVWTSSHLTKSAALKLEHKIKKLNKQNKEGLVAGNFNIYSDDVNCSTIR